MRNPEATDESSSTPPDSMNDSVVPSSSSSLEEGVGTLPQFKIVWMDEYFDHLNMSVQKFNTVLFNTSVEMGDLNQFDPVEFEKKIKSLVMDENNHVMVITSLSKGKGYQILEILKGLKMTSDQRLNSCVYSGTALRSPIVQNLCLLKYEADFVSSLNNAHAILELESFVAQVYQKTFYPKLMKFLSRLLYKCDNMEHLISPTNPLVREHMTLQEEINRQALKQQGKEYDSRWELVPLRKIAHNLHLQQSSCLSLTHRPLVQQPQFLVMIQTGALNPPHKMHQQGFNVAKLFVENYENMAKAIQSKPKLQRELLEKQIRPIKVVGCFMSPSHDIYIQQKASKYDYKQQRVYTGNERLTMCSLQTEDDPFTCEYPWEAHQTKFISFSNVTNSCSEIIRSSQCPISILMPKNPTTGHYQDSSSYLRVSYTCGADLILRAGLRKFNYFEDMLALVLGRHGVNMEEVMKAVNDIHGNLPVFYIEMENLEENGISSTEVRTCLENISRHVDVANSTQRLSQILDRKVLEYIIKDCNK